MTGGVRRTMPTIPTLPPIPPIPTIPPTPTTPSTPPIPTVTCEKGEVPCSTTLRESSPTCSW
eukprot:scaffold105100_cov22-Phaeocystis_antarctica.AAC.1